VKKLRYLLATIQPLLTLSPNKPLEKIKSYLTLMGDIQDSAVLTNNLNKFYNQQVPENIQQVFQKQQQELLRNFIQHQQVILNCW
jgi:CHAD domain-containing protein